ncbi:MAG: hypothetical protein ABW061_04150 [Polyangiaceae bacterium]
MRHRYPFEALHWLRHQRVDQQAKVVGESALRSARARAEEARRALERQNSERLMWETASAERSQLDEGQQRAADLQLAGEWRKGAEAEVRAKVEQEQRAREARLAQAAAEAAERRALGHASNQAKMIETHRGVFRAEREAARERSDEEAATEQWTASRFPPRRS